MYRIVPILPNLEVSGVGASQFSLGPLDWTWEDLSSTSGHPIAQYHVYRTSGNGSGTFDCVFQNAVNLWQGGDPEIPAAGSLFSYLVIAVNSSGEATHTGSGTDGTPRALSTLPCPP